MHVQENGDFIMEVYIVDAVRTAVGSFGGTLSKASSVDLGKAEELVA